jgi:Tol biopolymer transport system component
MRPDISADGRYVTFESGASTLVSGDTNGTYDIFVHDWQTGQTTRTSVASNGAQGDGFSDLAVISADGRYVAFRSAASNLVPDDTNSNRDIFVHDRQTGQTRRVSVASDGTQGYGDSFDCAISADGRYVSFVSGADNLVADDTNGHLDIFVHDLQTGQTSRVSVATDGTQGDYDSHTPTLSADGRYVAFDSQAGNLAPDDTNGCHDVFIHDRQTGETVRVSAATDGTQGDSISEYPAISGDGRYVAYRSYATNLVPGDTNGTSDIFWHDRQTGETRRVSVASDGTQGNGYSDYPSISGDGQYVGFYSYSDNLVAGDTNGAPDAFVYHWQTGVTTRISIASDGTQGNGPSALYALSSDGSFVAFSSQASNLAPNDTNSAEDVFVHVLGTGKRRYR